MTDLVPVSGLPAGLEDFDLNEGGSSSDLVFRFPKILAKEGKIEIWQGEEDDDGDRITKTVKSVTGVILGRQKARTAFLPNVLTGEGLICSSKDAKIGNPRLGPDGRPAVFPVGFNPAYDADNGVTTLSCDTCEMKEFDTYKRLPDANSNSKRPACGEVHKIPIWVPDEGEDGEIWIFEFKSTQIKALTQFLRPFATQGKPTWSQQTTIKLNVEKTDAGHKYSVPVFAKHDDVDVEGFEAFHQMWDETRSFLTRQPKGDVAIAEAEVVVQSSNAIGAGDVTDLFPGATVRSNEIEL